MVKLLTLTSALALMSSSVLADHGNPWATEGDVVLSKNHDTNQLRSVDAPGEDEMRGAIVRNARGKLGGSGSSSKMGGQRAQSKPTR